MGYGDVIVAVPRTDEISVCLNQQSESDDLYVTVTQERYGTTGELIITDPSHLSMLASALLKLADEWEKAQ